MNFVRYYEDVEQFFFITAKHRFLHGGAYGAFVALDTDDVALHLRKLICYLSSPSSWLAIRDGPGAIIGKGTTYGLT